jgi:hypothetical protein
VLTVLVAVLVATELLSSVDEPPPPQPETAIKAKDRVRKAKGEGWVFRVMVLGAHVLVTGL